MKDRLISEISSSLESMRGHSVIAQKHIWDLKHTESFEPRDAEALSHMAEHLAAVNRQLNSYIVVMESHRT